MKAGHPADLIKSRTPGDRRRLNGRWPWNVVAVRRDLSHAVWPVRGRPSEHTRSRVLLSFSWSFTAILSPPLVLAIALLPRRGFSSQPLERSRPGPGRFFDAGSEPGVDRRRARRADQNCRRRPGSQVQEGPAMLVRCRVPRAAVNLLQWSGIEGEERGMMRCRRRGSAPNQRP